MFLGFIKLFFIIGYSPAFLLLIYRQVLCSVVAGISCSGASEFGYRLQARARRFL